MNTEKNSISYNGSFAFAPVRFFAGYYFDGFMTEKIVRA